MAEIINSCDVACFVKPGGICPFCKMALALLEDLKARQSFRLHSEDLFSDEREALRLMEQPAQVMHRAFCDLLLPLADYRCLEFMDRSSALCVCAIARPFMAVLQRPSTFFRSCVASYCLSILPSLLRVAYAIKPRASSLLAPYLGAC